MAVPLLPSGLSIKNVGASVFGGGAAPNVQAASTEKQQFVEQTKQFVQTQKQNQTVIANMQQQFQNFQNQLNALSQSINNIAALLQKDTLTEQQLLKQQQEQENRYAQRRIRLGRESRLEERIQTAIMAPVDSAAKKVEGVFANVGRAIQTLFFGYLGVQLLKTIKAYSEDDQKTLNEIKDNVIKNVGFVIGTFIAIKTGFAAIKFALRKLIGGVAGLLFGGIKNIFTSAASKIGGIFSGLFSGIGGGKSSRVSAASSADSSASSTSSTSSGKGSTSPSSTSTPSSGGKPSASSGGGFWGGMKNFGKGVLGGGAKLLGGAGLTAGLDIAFGEDPATAAVGGLGSAAAAGAASKLPLPGLLKPLAVIGAGIWAQQKSKELVKGKEEDSGGGFDWTFGLGKKKEDTSTQPQQNTKQPPVATSTPTQTMTGAPPKAAESSEQLGPIKSQTEPVETGKDAAEPKNTMMPQPEELKLSLGSESKMNTESATPAAEIKAESISPQNEKAQPAELTSPSTQEVSSGDTSNIFNISKNLSFDFINPSQEKMTSPQSIAPLEEPAPNVVVAQQPQAPQESPQAPPTPTDVPMIPSSNPDNFYVLYSKLNYNVVI